eukprot:3839269-Prymnesium_polylepis.1
MSTLTVGCLAPHAAGSRTSPLPGAQLRRTRAGISRPQYRASLLSAGALVPCVQFWRVGARAKRVSLPFARARQHSASFSLRKASGRRRGDCRGTAAGEPLGGT